MLPSSPLCLRQFIHVILFICTLNYVGADCVFGKYDLSTLDWPLWNVTVHQNEVTTHYQLSLCSPVPKFCNEQASVCVRQGDASVTWVPFASRPRVTENGNNTGFWLHYSGGTCASETGKYYQIAINFVCGVGLGSPILEHSSSCNLYFKWTTSAACSVKTIRREVPCYIYDRQDQRRDLSPLILATGAYRVKSSVPAIEFEINVCSSIGTQDWHCADGTGACRKIGSEVIDFGQPLSPLSIDVDGNLQLTYSTSKSKIPGGCTLQPKTIITFVCPRKQHRSRFVQFKEPILTGMSNCQYEVEWVTENACPETQLVSTTCQLRKDDHGVELDLTPLKKPPNDPYVIEATIDNKKTTFYLNLCEGMSKTCHGSSQTSTSVCMNDVVIGSSNEAKLKFVDDELTMTYEGGDKCSYGNSQTRTIINFKCDHNADRGTPKFYTILDNCTFIFDWITNFACIGNRAQLQCQANNGNEYFDLSLLTKPNGAWDVMTTGLAKYRSTQIVMNVCSTLNTDGQFSNCPHESAVCMKGADGTMLSLGRYETAPKYIDSKTVQLEYVKGSRCTTDTRPSSLKTYSTIITFICNPSNTDNGPILTGVSNDECTFELEWSTATACSQVSSIGSDCKVLDKELDIVIDLSPLRRTKGAYKTSNDEYDFYLNVCGESTAAECSTVGRHSACQVKKNQTNMVWNLGTPNDKLRYVNGMVNLTYTGGTPYNVESKPLRQTSITFLCDPEADNGHPEFVNESEQKYNFKWYTSLVCLQRPVECSLTSTKNETYDLSSLTKSSSDSNWEIEFDVGGRKKKMILNVCHSITANLPGCSSQSAACLIDLGKENKVINAGNAVTQPHFENGIVTLKYEFGDKCDEFNSTYTTYIHFMCAENKMVNNIKPFNTMIPCVYMFIWETDAACPVQTSSSSNDDCHVIDRETKFEYDLSPLKGTYSVTSDSLTFDIGLCGMPVACSKTHNNNTAVCKMTVDRKNAETLALTTLKSISLPEPNRIVVTYQNALNTQTGNPSSVVDIEFLCNPKSATKEIKFVKQDGMKYSFRMETSIACVPETVECTASDDKGNVYDLSGLARMDANWEVEDMRMDFADYHYYINICRPLVWMRSPGCTGSDIGACQVSKLSDKGFSLGSMRSQPKVTGTGELKLIYEGGTPCHNAPFNRSFHIEFHCSNVEEAPKFITETAECEYIVSWSTPVACSFKVVKGANCKVQDPQFEHEFDLTSLNHPVEVQRDGSTFRIGVCDTVDCGDANGVGVCEIKDNKFSSAGKASNKLVYKNGELSLAYQETSTTCPGQKRSTKIVFSCSTVTDDKPTLIPESSSCNIVFVWKTTLACNPTTIIDCKTIDANGNIFDLSPLTMESNNYEYIMPDKKRKFFINVCHSVHHTSSALCNFSSGICSVDMSETDQTKKFQNLGNVVKGPYFENGVLRLKYESGDDCKNGLKHQSVISFHCDKSKIESEPVLLRQSNCMSNFIWDTAAACSISTDNDTVIVSDSYCRATNPVTGFQFDLNALKRSVGYTFSDNRGHNYTINVCESLPNSVCGEKSGACQWKEAENKHWSMGIANSNLRFRNGILYLNYTDGSSCHSGKFSRTTIIQFTCSHSPGIGEPVFFDESDDCTYYVNWHTNLACENQVYCKVDAGTGMIDLTPLATRENRFTLTALGDYSVYLINVCRPLNPIPHVECPPEAAACKYSHETNEAFSLGQIENPPYLDKNGHATIVYTGGSQCPSDKSKRIQSRIIFVCQNETEESLPELIEINDCEYVFEWETNIACKKTSTPLTYTGAEMCTFVNSTAKTIFDLTSLKSYWKTHKLETNNKNTVFSLCDAVSSPCGKDSAICDNSRSLGKSSSVRAVYEDNMLKLTFMDGDKCQENQKWSSDIWFICDESNAAEPVLVETLPCHKYFHWKTNAACTAVAEECTVFVDNNFFDFRLLSSHTSGWSVKGTDTLKFMLNVCHGLPFTLDPVPLHRCSHTDAACVVDSSGHFYGIGQATTQKFIVEDGKDVVLNYKGALPIPLCGEGEMPETSINFRCGNARGRPTFVNAEQCHFKFDWSTILACPNKPKHQDDGLVLTNGLVHDQLLNLYINFSTLINKSFVVDEDRDHDHFTYEIVLDPNTPTFSSCHASGVCQSDLHASHRLVGNLSNSKLYRTDDALDMVLSSKSPCERNSKKNASTIITFDCTASSELGQPQLLYESMDCVFMFTWPTNLSCFSNYFDTDEIDKNSTSSEDNMSTGSIFIIVGAVLIVVVAIIFIVSKQSVRDAANYRLRQLWRRTKWRPSYHYTVLPQSPETNTERTSLLNQEELHHIQALHDDSDDEVLQF